MQLLPNHLRHLIEVEERAVGRVVGGNDRVKSGSRSLDLSSRVNAVLFVLVRLDPTQAAVMSCASVSLAPS
jgi:hypothetical protein